MTCLLYCRFRSQGTKGNKYSWDLFDEELLKWSAEANLVDFPSGGSKLNRLQYLPCVACECEE